MGCTNDDPDHDTDFEDDFVTRSVACTPLYGASFHADPRKVHQLLMNFLVEESAKQWIKGISNRVNGRLDLQSLCNHYGGEGNVIHWIATVEKLRETLHYKSAWSLPFKTFLDRMQKMFNIFREEREELSENAKVCQLLKRVQHNELQDTIKALHVHFDLAGITYTGAANHLTLGYGHI